jgi:hypothetical protein
MANEITNVLNTTVAKSPTLPNVQKEGVQITRVAPPG